MKYLNNISIVGKNNFINFGPTISNINSLTYSTPYNKSFTITVNKPTILREVSIYTRICDNNHIDINNRFQIIIATNSVAYGNYVGWQASGISSASNIYYIQSNYHLSNLLSATPSIQKLPLDLYLPIGSYYMYLDETYNTICGIDSVGYIMCTTHSSYPYINEYITIYGESIHNQRTLAPNLGNIFFNWVVSDVDDVLIENGSLNLSNKLNTKQTSFSLLNNNIELFGIKNKEYSTTQSVQLTSATTSIVIKNTLKIGNKTNYNNLYDNLNNGVYMADVNNVGAWINYNNYANVINNNYNYWNSGTTSNSDFIHRGNSIIDSLPTASNILDLKSNISNNFIYKIIDNTTGIKINATMSILSAGTNLSNYLVILDPPFGPTVSYPGWKIIII